MKRFPARALQGSCPVCGTKLTKIAQAPIGRWSQGIAFSADGGTILVQNMLERDIQVFRFDGSTLAATGQRIPRVR